MIRKEKRQRGPGKTKGKLMGISKTTHHTVTAFQRHSKRKSGEKIYDIGVPLKNKK
jgi:hypothetical protein